MKEINGARMRENSEYTPVCFKDELKVHRLGMPGWPKLVYLKAEVDFPLESGVVVVVYPRKRQSFEDPEMLQEAENRSNDIVRCLSQILTTGFDVIRKMLNDGCFEESTKYLPDETILEGLQLSHIKLNFETADEIILRGNTPLHCLDLNLKLNSNLGISEAWLDG